jgi:hypothetical protein
MLRRAFAIGLAALVIAAAPMPVAAQTVFAPRTEAELVQSCVDVAATDLPARIQAPQATMCFSFLHGLWVGLSAASLRPAPTGVPQTCLPEGVPFGEMRQAYLDYMRERPAMMTQPAGTAAIVAFMLKYRCAG